MFVYQIVFQIKGKIAGPWNIGNCDLVLVLGQRSGQNDLLSQTIMFMLQIAFQDVGKNHHII